MSEVIYIVCSSTGPTTTSESNSNKFHKWVKQADGQWLHSWGRVGDAGRSQVDDEAKMQKKLKASLKEGYQKIEVAADVGSGTVNGPALAKQDVRQKAIDEIAGPDTGLRDLVSMLVDRNTRDVTSTTTLKMNDATGLFQTDGGIIVTRNVVEEARHLLNKIKITLKGPTVRSKFDEHAADQLACDYLMRIPTNIGRNRPTFDNVFPDKASIDKQDQILDALLGSIDMLSKPQPKKDEPKVEVKRTWNVKLTPTDVNELKRIDKYFRSTFQSMHAAAQAGLKPKRAWYLTISHMDEAFKNDGAKVGNVKELWHGTRVGNLLSIFSRGLIIPPWADAGRMFGDGIYFSDQSTKSLNYAYGYWSGGSKDNTCYMLLNDVALGKSYIPKSSGSWKKAPDGYDSTFARAGEVVHNNEMIVYRASQCHVTRLVEFGN
jgi:poly [ADP-ribose] polymerase